MLNIVNWSFKDYWISYSGLVIKIYSFCLFKKSPNLMLNIYSAVNWNFIYYLQLSIILFKKYSLSFLSINLS